MSFIYWDCKLKCAEMSFDEFTKFMEIIIAKDTQWVVEWWRNSSMVHRCLKDNCVPLVGLRYSSYYSTCCIARQFGDHQGAPSDDGAFHTLVLTKRTLDRIRESWRRQRVTRGIHPLRVLHPTSRYKKWIEDDVKWVPKDEKAYQKSNKRRRAE